MNFLPKTKIFKTQLAKDIVLSLLIVLLFEVLGGVLTLTRTPEYRSQAKVLIIQKQLETHDVFSSTKASEKIAQDLVNVIPTAAFLGSVLDNGFLQGNLVFPGDDRSPLEIWRESIFAEAQAGTAIIKLTAFEADPKRAQSLVDAAYLSLLSSGALYHGGGDQVIIKTLDPPLVSSAPVRPDYFINFIFSVMVGALLGLATMYSRRHYRNRNREKLKSVLEREKQEISNQPDTRSEIRPDRAQSFIKKETAERAVIEPVHQRYFFEVASSRDRED